MWGRERLKEKLRVFEPGSGFTLPESKVLSIETCNSQLKKGAVVEGRIRSYGLRPGFPKDPFPGARRRLRCVGTTWGLSRFLLANC